LDDPAHFIVQEFDQSEVSCPGIPPFIAGIPGAQKPGDVIQLQGRLAGVPLAHIVRQVNLLAGDGGKIRFGDMEGWMRSQKHAVEQQRLGFVALSDGPLCLVANRKSTRLNSSHVKISYAVYCLKKKN